MEIQEYRRTLDRRIDDYDIELLRDDVARSVKDATIAQSFHSFANFKKCFAVPRARPGTSERNSRAVLSASQGSHISSFTSASTRSWPPNVGSVSKNVAIHLRRLPS